MECLKFNFCHPVKGYARLIHLSGDPSKTYAIQIDSKSSNLVEIPINRYLAGKWKIILEWQYDDQSFTHQKEFEIKKESIKPIMENL